MQFETFAEFVAMGRHGLFVWSSYAVFVVVLAINVVTPILRKKQLITRLQRSERRRAAEAASQATGNPGESPL